MKKAILSAIILSLAVVLLYAVDSSAQDEQSAVLNQSLTDVQEAYGEVASIDAAASTISITEYDYEKDEDVNKTYKVDKAAAFENVKSLAEVKTGDWVALTLKPQKGATPIATSVYVERYDLGEEAAPTAPAAPAVSAAPVTPVSTVVTPAPAPEEETPQPASAPTEEMPAEQDKY